MANKRFLLAMLAIALVFGMTVAGCDDAQIVAFERADSVSNLSVRVYMSKDEYDNPVSRVTVSWDAAKNAVSYDVYSQSDIARTFGLKSEELDIQHLSFVPAEGLSGMSYSFPNPYYDYIQPRYMRYGVTATDFDTNHAVSNIVWSDWIDMTKTGSTGGGGGKPDLEK
jgi:hypothetical protein